MFAKWGMGISQWRVQVPLKKRVSPAGQAWPAGHGLVPGHRELLLYLGQ